MSSELKQLNQSNFSKEILKYSGVCVVDFWSETCIPCKQMSRLLNEIRAEIADEVVIGKVNADENSSLVEQYGVRGLPTLLIFKKGQLVETRSGIDRKQVIRKAIESYLI
ncbi:MAG: thioredoxin family protein [Betaproteobacteria bacterium]|jgi:thioredoxin 1